MKQIRIVMVCLVTILCFLKVSATTHNVRFYHKAGLPASWPNECPQSHVSARVEGHEIPMTIYYTGRFDSRMDRSDLWPINATFAFLDNDGLEESMRRLSESLSDDVPGLFEAFEDLMPWAYRSDLWRYAILYQCGGIYLDAKYHPQVTFSKFLNQIGFHKGRMRSKIGRPQLFSAVDEVATAKVRSEKYRGITCVYQGFMTAERKHPLLLHTIRRVVENVKNRWYPSRDLSIFADLFITGPCAVGTIVRDVQQQDVHNGDWDLVLSSRLGYNGVNRPRYNPIRYIVPTSLERGRDGDDEMYLAAFVADERLHKTQRSNYYIDMFKNRLVYRDDEAYRGGTHQQT